MNLEPKSVWGQPSKSHEMFESFFELVIVLSSLWGSIYNDCSFCSHVVFDHVFVLTFCIDVGMNSNIMFEVFCWISRSRITLAKTKLWWSLQWIHMFLRLRKAWFYVLFFICGVPCVASFRCHLVLLLLIWVFAFAASGPECAEHLQIGAQGVFECGRRALV